MHISGIQGVGLCSRVFALRSPCHGNHAATNQERSNDDTKNSWPRIFRVIVTPLLIRRGVISMAWAPECKHPRTEPHALYARDVHLVLQNEPNLCSPANSPGLNVLVASAIQERGFKGCQRLDSDGMVTSA